MKFGTTGYRNCEITPNGLSLNIFFYFCEENRFSKLNNYRQVVIGEEQLEVLGVNVIEEVSIS